MNFPAVKCSNGKKSTPQKKVRAANSYSSKFFSQLNIFTGKLFFGEVSKQQKSITLKFLYEKQYFVIVTEGTFSLKRLHLSKFCTHKFRHASFRTKYLKHPNFKMEKNFSWGENSLKKIILHRCV